MINDVEKFALLFNNVMEGVAIHSYVFDDDGKIIDYLYENVNPAFERILDLKKEDVLGKSTTEVLKVKEPPYLKEYAGLVKNKSYQFDVFFEPLQRYFSVSAVSLGKDSFATIFFDITCNKQTEEKLKEQNDDLEKMNHIMVDREVKMVELKEELKKVKEEE